MVIARTLLLSCFTAQKKDSLYTEQTFIQVLWTHLRTVGLSPQIMPKQSTDTLGTQKLRTENFIFKNVGGRAEPLCSAGAYAQHANP